MYISRERLVGAMRKIFLIAGALFAILVIVVTAALVFILATTPYGPAPVSTPSPSPEPSATPEPEATPTSTPTPTPAVPTMVLYNKVFEIPAGHYSYLYDNHTLNSFAAGNLVTVVISADNPVTFLILNESNYQVFSDAMENLNPTPNWDYYLFKPKIINETIHFTVPKTDSYYFVVDNSGALTPDWAPINEANVHVVVTASK
jgi:hypothetical protein